ncbi:hypothetical protein J2Z69_000341 [Paenibacillus shirakamiensis]|uniref:Lipoprotein n=1 Tax=Paenibacillus shirakamiensis TaxID=1265935 RepID=A0ABS4JC79_9BACL|nr:hypothetical protein [Paenibacillus shirakamiensis]MBP1999322.1 hypothetical protein [Paenibacillus shirakamiensis]
MHLTKIRLTICGVLLCTLLLASCGNSRSGAEWFDFTWAGLAGSDTLSFDGEASLVAGNQQQAEGIVQYEGQLQNHKLLTMTTQYSDHSAVGQVGMASATDAAQQSHMEWRMGKWSLLSKPSDEQESHPVQRINPLSQLEEIHQAKDKKISLESMAARGTKVLRIELGATEAKAALQRELESEMNQVLVNWEGQQQKIHLKESSAQKTKRKEQAYAIWNEGKQKMEERLNTVKVKTTYHLTINSRSGLPQSITSETHVSGTTGNAETMITNCRFHSYDK